MKHYGWLIAVICMISASGAGAEESRLNAIQRTAAQWSPIAPLWLAQIFAPFGVADAQARVGYEALANDPCKGANFLQSAAKQHHLFAEINMMDYYRAAGRQDNGQEQLQKALLWHLHFMTHFPDEEDVSHEIVEMLKLEPEQESAARERFKTWDPEKESPIVPASCAGKPLEY